MRYAIPPFLLLTAPAHAAMTATGPWPIEQLRAECIPIVASDLASERSCTVNAFGKLATPGHRTYYYALYWDYLPENGEPNEHDASNVLVMFRDDDGGNGLVVERTSNKERWWSRSFGAPRILRTDLGPVLHQPGSGIGDGRATYNYDEYWLWQHDAWVQLDVWSWADWHSFDQYLPEGVHLDGVSKTEFSLPDMRYVGNLRRDGDCHSCAPTGGHVNVDFEWDGLVLRVREVEYGPPDPDEPSSGGEQ